MSPLSDISAVVLCAGLGTRLRPLTLEIPKPLLPVGDRPLLALVAEELSRFGFRHMWLNTHHQPDQFPTVLAGLPLEASVVHEPRIRGTAGGVAGLSLRTSRALVWNGDIFARPPIAALLERALEVPMVLGVRPGPLGQGTIGLDGTRVVRLRGERFGTETRSGDYIGVLALGETAIRALPEVGCLFDDLALPAMRAGQVFAESVAADAPFCDIGTPAAYLELNLAWLTERDLDHWVAPSAVVESGVELRSAVVGSGARIRGSGLMERVVVWPNAVARAPLSDAIVTPNAVVSLTR